MAIVKWRAQRVARGGADIFRRIVDVRLMSVSVLTNATGMRAIHRTVIFKTHWAPEEIDGGPGWLRSADSRI